MSRARRVLPVALGLLLAHPHSAGAQTTTYHLHAASSGDFCCRALTTSGPAPTATALQTSDLKNQTGSAYVWGFQTLAGTGQGGTIPTGSTLTFSLWMKKTSTYGVIAPQAKLLVNNTITLCSAIGPALGTAPTMPVTFSCPLGASVPQSTTDLLRLWVGYSISTPPGNHSVKVELDVDGTTDSKTIVPNPVPPHITAVNPTSGPANWSVVMTGTNFGASQGGSSVLFNTTAATSVTAWSDTSVTAAVPAGVTPGPGTVTVKVGGAVSNGVAFTVIPAPALTSVAPASGHIGDTVTIAGANFLATQGTSTVKFGVTVAAPTSWNDTTIVTPVPATAATGSVVVRVSGQDSNGVVFTVIVPGTVAGTITQAANGNPLVGATVQAVFQGLIKATGTTPSNGSYSLGSLDPGTYDLRVYGTGYSSEVRSAAITSNATTTINVSMFHPGSIAGRVTQADGLTPISGAAVTVFSGPTEKGRASTNGTGDYSIASLHPGTFTVEAANVGYHTKDQGAAVNENATTTANLSLDPEPAGPVLYAYDALGRLIQVTDPSGDAAIYRYDPVGNITAIERPGTTVVSISGFTPASGAGGATVTIAGTGFSPTPSQNTVTFACGPSCTVNATVTAATSTQLAVTVPATAVTGAIAVTAQGQTATASAVFTVTAAGAAPTISGFTPAFVVAGNTLTVTGTNFDTTPANDRLTANVASAQVTSATPTSLQATVPVTTTGRVSIATQNGSATSADYLWVAPAPYTVGLIDSTGLVTFGVATVIPVNTAGKVALRAFEGTQGHRASVSLTSGTFAAGGAIGIYGVYGDLRSTGFVSTGFLEPIGLTATGTQTLLLAPNSGTGSGTVTVYDVPPDVTGPILAGGPGVPVSMSVPGQNARLTFSGTAGQRVSVATTATTMASGILQVLRPDGTPLKSFQFIAGFTGFLDTVSLATTGTYTVFANPDTTNTGGTTLTLYDVPPDTTGTVAIDGAAVPVPLGTPGQNGSLTFSGTQNQHVTVHVTGNTMGDVTVKLLSSDGQTVLAQFLGSGSSFDLLTATLPTAGTATYTITIDPSTTGTGTLNINVTSS